MAICNCCTQMQEKKMKDPTYVLDEIPIQKSSIFDNKIKYIICQTSKSVGNTDTSLFYKSYYIEFNESGQKVLQHKFDSEENLIYEWIFNKKGVLIEEISRDKSADINFRIEYVYNNSIYWTEKKMVLSGGILSYRIIANRDTNNNIISSIYINSQEKKLQENNYLYDNNSNLIKEVQNGFGEWTFKYDKNNNIILKDGNFPGQSVLGNTYKYYYDNKGLLQRIEHNSFESTILKYSFRK